MTATSDIDAEGAESAQTQEPQEALPLRQRTVIGDPGRAFREVTASIRACEPGPPDTVLDGGTIGRLEVRAASVCGLSHREAVKPRQDAYAVCSDASGAWLVAVVADGVSAGDLSHTAAAMVAQQGSRRVAELLATQSPQELDWYQIFHELAQAVLANGERLLRRRDPAASPTQVDVARSMSTTATFVVCATDHDGSHREVTVAWLGDSPVWAVTADGGWVSLSAVKTDQDGMASNAVVGLPYLPSAAEALPVRHLSVDPAAVVLAMTDGVGDPLGEARGEVAAALAQLWRTPPEPLEFAEQIAFGRKGYDDDRTVVGIWPARLGPR